MGISISYLSDLISYERFVQILVVFVLVLGFRLLDCYNDAYNKKKERDEKLFKQPPPQEEDCPLCFLQLPSLWTGYEYQSCCGKVICSGCIHAVGETRTTEIPVCPFCRTPFPITEVEALERQNKRVEADDAYAIFNHGIYYREGIRGLPQDYAKALELFHRSGELGYVKAYVNIGYTYEFGRGVEVDKKKAKYYNELAAIGGDSQARYNLGCMEENVGNEDRALKHYLIAARSGFVKSLEAVKDLYSEGHATKEDYTNALRSYQTYLSEIKSVQRDTAAATERHGRYY